MIYDYRKPPKYIETPGGPGKLMNYDPNTKTVTVFVKTEAGERLFVYPAEFCYIPMVKGATPITRNAGVA